MSKHTPMSLDELRRTAERNKCQYLPSPDSRQLPWFASRSCTGWNIRDANGEPFGHFEDEGGVKMLIRTVNTHDELVAACEAVEDLVDNLVEQRRLSRDDGDAFLETVDAALAKAKEAP